MAQAPVWAAAVSASAHSGMSQQALSKGPWHGSGGLEMCCRCLQVMT